jgi:hypothetical protein
MEMVMDEIRKRAGYYRGYHTEERSLVPLTIVLGITIALWLLVYLIGAVGDPYKPPLDLLHHAPPAGLSTEVARHP